MPSKAATILKFKQPSAAVPQSDVPIDQPAHQPRAELPKLIILLKLIVLLAMIFVPWAVIGYVVWLLSSR